MHRVFVYGTLKRGFRNHGFLETASFIGAAYTQSAYRMLDGPYPVLRHDGRKLRQVSGELYEVDDTILAKLDELEGVAEGLYERIMGEVVLTARDEAQNGAFIYIGCDDYWDKTDQLEYSVTDRRGHLNWLAPHARAK